MTTKTAWTLADTLKEYDADHHGADAEMDRFCNMPSLAEAIRTAAESRDEDGDPYPHQRRNWNFWPNSFAQATRQLLRAERRFESCSDFDAIHELVKELLIDVEGLKTLYCYDVAVRIGSYLGKLPERVYLHAGTLQGARRLMRLPKNKRVLEMSELPPALRDREPWEVENILCHHAKCCKRHERNSGK